MKIESYFVSLIRWLSTTELFARPSKQIPGKWQLYEYYTEPVDVLIHFKEKELKEEKLYWEIEFFEGGQLSQISNIKLFFPDEPENLKWNRTGMFITFANSENYAGNVKFQYAVEKQGLRLLKKNESGKIEFFGFFRKINSQ